MNTFKLLSSLTLLVASAEALAPDGAPWGRQHHMQERSRSSMNPRYNDMSLQNDHYGMPSYYDQGAGMGGGYGGHEGRGGYGGREEFGGMPSFYDQGPNMMGGQRRGSEGYGGYDNRRGGGYGGMGGMRRVMADQATGVNTGMGDFERRGRRMGGGYSGNRGGYGGREEFGGMPSFNEFGGGEGGFGGMPSYNEFGGGYENNRNNNGRSRTGYNQRSLQPNRY